MAVSAIQKSNVSGTITMVNGATTLAAAYDRGDLTIGPLKAVLNQNNPVERRGRFVGLVTGARIYPQLSFSAWLTQFAEASAPGDLIDWILNKDAYSALTSTLGSGTPYTSDMTYKVEGTDFGDAADHTFTTHDVDWTLDNYTETDSGLFIQISGTIYGELSGDIAIDEIT